MIGTQLARRLRELGLTWHPQPGDAFRIDRPEFDTDVFTVSDMTVEAHEFDTGTILGFNGTTEWALDSVALENALWLPREDQLRELLGDVFHCLIKDDGVYRVETVLHGGIARFDAAENAADAYALALLAQMGDLQSRS
ncbi:MAG: pilus assembly protein CpaE [Microbacteriaceae bacterium]